jgi:hypothetical protein
MRAFFVFTFAVVALVVAGYAPVRSQDKLDPAAINKKRTIELLEKATDEYRVFFKKPETTFEFWAAIKFEMDLGKFDLAALHLKLLLEKDAKQVDADLVKLEDAEGISAFLRLERVKQWSDHPPFQEEAVKNVDTLIKRVTKAVETHLSDPVRIKKYINHLDARTPEERAYAYAQLARSRERAVPYIVEGLRTNYGKSLFPRLRETLLRFSPDTVPVYLEVFKAANDKDYRDLELRLTMLDIIKKRDDKRVVPYLWHMSASKKYPEAVRKKAKEVLASLLRMDQSDLPPARETLTEMAERYYQHKVPFSADKSVKVWEWNGEALALQPIELTPYRAEEEFGLRYAREALDLDPSYQPAQVVLLSMMLERTYKPKLQQVVSEQMPPKMQQLLTTIDTDLLMRVLERAMEDRQVAVALPLIQVLGERSELRAARAGSGDPRGLVRALYYPDRRVQYAGMQAMLRMPKSVVPAVASSRIVELCRRFVNSEQKGKALVVQTPPGLEQPTRQIVGDIGLEPVLADKSKKAVNEGRSSADYDLVILHRGMPEKDFPFVYAQLKKDADLSGLPMIVIADKGRENAIKKFTARDNVVVVPEDRFKSGDELKAYVEEAFKKAKAVQLTQAERKLFATNSMDALWRMAKGEIAGYDVMPALDVIKTQVRSPEYGMAALEILGRLPGRDLQALLARIVADPNEDLKQMRLPAVFEMNRHMQRYGVLIDKNQIADLRDANRAAAEGTPLRKELNVTLSMLNRSNAPRTGAELLKFRPDPPAAPKEKEKEKEKVDKQ